MGQEEQPLVEMRNISKSFGAVKAVDKVNLKLFSNEILGLVGDNGAGKSTLMKILAGTYTADEGEVFIEGKRAHITSPEDAKKYGIEMMYQDLSLADNLDVAGNIFLGREPQKEFLRGLIKVMDKKQMERKSMEALDQVGIKIGTVNRKVEFLSGGQRQTVAVGRAILANAKAIIMDEPTSALGVQETKEVLGLMKQLRAQGISIIMISHRMEDVFAVGDRVVVLRDGKKAGERKIGETEMDEVRMMIIGAKLGEKV